MIPIINGINYSYGDIALMLFGNTPIIGITSIDYKQEQDSELNYGQGNFPIGIGFGMFKSSGKIRIYREEMVKIIGLAPQLYPGSGGKIQAIPPFTIKVVYGNTSQAVVTDTLKFCVFKDNNFSAKSGDKKLENDVDLLIGEIVYGHL